MQQPSDPSGATLFPQGLEECVRTARLANPAQAEMGPVTWVVGFRVVEYNWPVWLENVFQPFLLPHLLEAERLGAAGLGRDLLALDVSGLAHLPPDLREASGRAGRILLRHGVPAGARSLQKLSLAVEKGEAVGHLATVFGARCGVFSISPRQMILAYLLTELHLGAPDWHDQELTARLASAWPLVEQWLQIQPETTRRWSHG